MSYLLSGWVASAVLSSAGRESRTVLSSALLAADARSRPAAFLLPGSIPLNGYSRLTGSTVEVQFTSTWLWTFSLAGVFCCLYPCQSGRFRGVESSSSLWNPFQSVRLLSTLLLPPRCCVKSPVTPVMPNAVVLPRPSQPLCCM